MYFRIENLNNQTSRRELQEYRRTALSALEDLSLEAIEQNTIFHGYRELHEKVGVSNRKHVASPENLARAFLRTGSLPEINVAVDVYNLVSLQSGLAIGAHDVAQIDGDVHLRLTTGTENFVPLGSTKRVPVRAGEYGYVDDSNDVICRLEVRQVEKTKVTPTTTDCFYIVQGNARTSDAYIMEEANRLVKLTTSWCGGDVTFLEPNGSTETTPFTGRQDPPR